MKYFTTLLTTLALSINCNAQSQDNNLLGALKDRIEVHGFAQGGYTYQDNSKPNNSFEMKRVILLARARVTDKWSFLLMHEPVSGKWQEYYTDYRFSKAFGARLGQMKTLITIENPIIPTQLESISLLSQAANFLTGTASDPLYGKQIGRDLGFMVYGDLFKDHLTYELGVFNGQGINVKDGNNQKDFQGKLTVKPVKELSLVTSFLLGTGHAIATSPFNPDIQAGDNYTRNRWTLGGVLNTKDFYLRAEYLTGKDGNAKSEGYYATARVPLVNKLDAVASYDYMNYNKTLGFKQTNYIAGLQYWFYRDCRLQLQYTRCEPKMGDGYNKLEVQTQISF